MGKILFHSPESRVEVQSCERARMGAKIASWFYSSLDVPRFPKSDNPFFDLIPKGCYLANQLQDVVGSWLNFECSLKVWLAVGEAYFEIGGYKVDVFGMQLNTAYLMGSDAVKLMTRLHGQCELHCYVEGQNREWLAGIIEKGLKTSVYSQGQGWESVIGLLRNGSKSTVVTSFSVCDEFPNPVIANFQPCTNEFGERDWDAWYSLQPHVRWEKGLEGLRRSKAWLELSPETWDSFYFSHGWDAFKLNQLLAIPRSDWEKLIELNSSTLRFNYAC